ERGVFLYSPDGAAWTQLSLPSFGTNLEAVVAVKSYADFVGIGSSGVSMSANLVPDASGLPATWNAAVQSTRTTVILRGIAQAANALFATGEKGVIISAPSVFGPWTAQT